MQDSEKSGKGFEEPVTFALSCGSAISRGKESYAYRTDLESPGLRRLRQEALELKASLAYTMIPYLKKNIFKSF